MALFNLEKMVCIPFHGSINGWVGRVWELSVLFGDMFTATSVGLVCVSIQWVDII